MVLQLDSFTYTPNSISSSQGLYLENLLADVNVASNLLHLNAPSDLITTILGCTSVRFDIYLGYLCFHGKKNIAIQQPRYSLNLLKDHPELFYHL